MKVTMLGNSGYPAYAFAPSNGYSRANGKGYVSPLGATQAVPSNMEQAVDHWLANYGGADVTNVPKSPSDPTVVDVARRYNVDASELYSKVKTRARKIKMGYISQGIESAASIGKSISNSVVSIADAIKSIKDSPMPENQKNEIIDSLQWRQFMPWIIGGGAALVGMFIIAGTSKRRPRRRYA